jgi:hypothetical protein
MIEDNSESKSESNGANSAAEEALNPEEIVKKYESRGQKLGGIPTVEQVNEIRQLWGIDGLEAREISKRVKLGVNVVYDSIRGIPRGKPPVEEAKTEIVEAPNERMLPTSSVSPIVVDSSMAISQKHLADLYLFALQRGYKSIDKLLDDVLIPLYAYFVDWEFKVGQRMTVEDFRGLITLFRDNAFKFTFLLEEAQKRFPNKGAEIP